MLIGCCWQITLTFQLILDSTDGLAAFARDDIDVLTVDAPIAANPDFLQIPQLAGGIGLTYNVPGVALGVSLNLSREALARIWLGEITNWNHTILTELNPGVILPDLNITLTWLPQSGVTVWFAQALASFMEDIDPQTAAGLRANNTLAYLPPVLQGKAIPHYTVDSPEGPLPGSLFALLDTQYIPGVLVYFINGTVYNPLPFTPTLAKIKNKASAYIRSIQHFLKNYLTLEFSFLLHEYR